MAKDNPLSLPPLKEVDLLRMVVEHAAQASRYAIIVVDRTHNGANPSQYRAMLKHELGVLADLRDRLFTTKGKEKI